MVMFVMRRRRILLMLAAALGIGIVLCWPRGPRDPVYDGKRLSQWMAETNRSSQPGMLTREAIQAVIALGTNALPYLVSEFERGGPKWLEDFQQTKFVSQTLKLRFEPKWLRRNKAIFRRNKAISAFYWLGPDAAPALPTFARYFDDPERGIMAVKLVDLTNEAGLPYLLKALSSTNRDVILYAIDRLGERGKVAEPALPLFIQLMDHSDKFVRLYSTLVLKEFPTAASLSVPALRRALSESEPSVQIQAMFVLGELGTVAKPAVPDLVKLLNDSNFLVVSNARNAMRKIDPSALPRSGH